MIAPANPPEEPKRPFKTITEAGNFLSEMKEKGTGVDGAKVSVATREDVGIGLIAMLEGFENVSSKSRMYKQFLELKIRCATSGIPEHDFIVIVCKTLGIKPQTVTMIEQEALSAATDYIAIKHAPTVADAAMKLLEKGSFERKVF